MTAKPRARVSGVYRCKSPWLCPVCATHKAFERAEKVKEVAAATYRRGGQVALVVLTASHRLETPLDVGKVLVAKASGESRKGRPWVSACEHYGILGVMVGQEITVSRTNGWHYHQHLSVPVDGPTADEIRQAGGDEERLAELVRERAEAAGRWIAESFKEAVRKAGGKVSDRHGTYVRVADDADDASDYTAKGSMAWEIAGGPGKEQTRAEDSMTPWDLAEAAYAGDAWARARWAEYVEGSKGMRSCIQTAALKKALDLPPAAKAKKGDQQLHEQDELAGQVQADIWRRWMRHGLASTFLARVELGGVEGFGEAVERTESDADAIEEGYERRDQAKAEREAERRGLAAFRRAAAEAPGPDAAAARRAAFATRQRDILLRVAVGRLRRSGHGTRDHIRRAIDDIAAQHPSAERLTEEAVVRALATLPEYVPEPSAWDDLLAA